MKKLLLTLILNFTILLVYSQYIEENGSIYSHEAHQKLAKIVDSLNLKFKKCEINKTYYAIPQTLGHLIESKNNFEAVKKDIDKGISFKAFEKKYPECVITKNALIFMDIPDDSETESDVWVTFTLAPLKYDEVIDELINLDQKKLARKWIYKERNSVDGKILTAFYFPKNFESPAIPQKYADMINYADCLVGTTTQVILVNDEKINSKIVESSPEIEAFRSLINQAQQEYLKQYPKPENLEKPLEKYKKDEYLPSAKELEEVGQKIYEFNLKLINWFENGQKYIENKVLENKNLLDQAFAFCIEHNVYDYDVEDYGKLLLSQEQILMLKRRNLITGGCSVSSGHIVHAQEIAELAAKTANWAIFLRSHLDIVNDKFKRNARSSYGEARHNPFFSEIDNLNINVFDLMLGTFLKAKNLANNHYKSYAGRIGRGFAETQKREEIETKILNALTDKSLDFFNRTQIFFMYIHYLGYIEDYKKIKKIENLKKLLENTQEDLWKVIDWEYVQEIITELRN